MKFLVLLLPVVFGMRYGEVFTYNSAGGNLSICSSTSEFLGIPTSVFNCTYQCMPNENLSFYYLCRDVYGCNVTTSLGTPCAYSESNTDLSPGVYVGIAAGVVGAISVGLYLYCRRRIATNEPH